MRSALLPPFALLAACGPQGLEPQAGALGGDGVTEISHTVAARFRNGEAALTVQRTFRNDGAQTAKLDRTVPLPDEGFCTGLRQHTATQGWTLAELLDAVVASERFDALTQPGEAEQPAQLALLSWSTDGQLSLTAWPLEPHAELTVEYQLRAPARYENGFWYLDYPRESDGAEPAFELGEGATVESREGVPRLWLERAPIDRGEARWATYALGSQRTAWRFELDAAAQLAPWPVRPSVVFAVDASHTEGEDGIKDQLALIPGWLAHAPDAQVEVVVFRRRAERLFGRFVPGSDFAAALAAVPADRLEPGNGSHLDRGAALAAEVLAGAAGARFVVLFTDDATRDALDGPAMQAALAALPTDAVAHLVVRLSDGSGLEEHRNDDHPFVDALAAHGGIALTMTGTWSEQEELAATLKGLVRPVRIDALSVEAEGLELTAPALLTEGDTFREMNVGEQAPAKVTVRGKLWAQPFERTAWTDGDLGELLPGLTIGNSTVRGQLTEAEERAAAERVHAVSAQTSYLSVSPDPKASKLGTLQGLGLVGSYGVGCGSRCGCRWTFREGKVDTSRPARALEQLLTLERARCGAPDAALDVEATRDEVVDVTVYDARAGAAACLEEAVWALRLPADVFWREHQTVHLGAE